ncbi:MAG: hypothetical protein KUG72_06010 [Pseudomonadales bacterium]|nr:hypothetical protein [Pseudomonadales bacterium]
MGQVTIYLDERVEQKMIDAAKSAQLSKSKWIAKLIQEKVANEWPSAIIELAGAWEDFPTLDAIRSDKGKDADRESL